MQIPDSSKFWETKVVEPYAAKHREWNSANSEIRFNPFVSTWRADPNFYRRTRFDLHNFCLKLNRFVRERFGDRGWQEIRPTSDLIEIIAGLCKVIAYEH